jgi:hypothetical protein
MSTASQEPELTFHTTATTSISPPLSQTLPSRPTTAARENTPLESESPAGTAFQSATVELVSVSASSSAFAESFGLSISEQGRWIMAYTSAALYIIYANDLPFFERKACRAFRLRKKPLAVAITDAGFFAVLTSTYKIDIYRCGNGSSRSIMSAPLESVQTVLLVNETKTIALSPRGDMIAAGSDEGVEIVALGMAEGSSDRRQINCGCPLDWISFSNDAKSLLATGPAASRRSTPTTVLLTISGGFDQGFGMEDDYLQPEQPVPKLWISQLIFPEKLQAGQASFLPDHSAGSATANEEILAYNSRQERFGIFDTALKQFNGKLLGFPEEVSWELLDHYDDVLPGVSSDGCHVAVAMTLKGQARGSEIWTYEVEAVWREEALPPNSLGSTQPSQSNLIASRRLKLPQDKDHHPSEFVSCLRWVKSESGSSSHESNRLIALINTIASNVQEDLTGSSASSANAKIILFNVSKYESLSDLYGSSDEMHQRITINLDDFALTEDLKVEEVALEREVDIVRRRTQVRSQRRLPASNRENRPRRSATSAPRSSNVVPRNVVPATTSPAFPVPGDLHRHPADGTNSTADDDSATSSPLDPTAAAGAGVDEPYSHSAPRSRFTLQRAATVAQASPAARMHLRGAPTRPLDYRPANGTVPAGGQRPRQAGQEGLPPGVVTAGPGNEDDGWVAPPPPYSERPDNVASMPIESIPGMADAVLRGQLVGQQQQQSRHASSRMRARVSRVVTVPIPIPVPPQSQGAATTSITPSQGPVIQVAQGASTSRRLGAQEARRLSGNLNTNIGSAASLHIPRSAHPTIAHQPLSAGPVGSSFPASAPVTPVDNLRRARTSHHAPTQPIQPNLSGMGSNRQSWADRNRNVEVSRSQTTTGGNTVQQNVITGLSSVAVHHMPLLSDLRPPVSEIRRPVTEGNPFNRHNQSTLHMQSHNDIRSLTHGYLTNQEASGSSRSLSRLETAHSAPIDATSMSASGTARRQGWWRMGGGDRGNRSRSWSTLDHRQVQDERLRIPEEKEKKCVLM